MVSWSSKPSGSAASESGIFGPKPEDVFCSIGLQVVVQPNVIGYQPAHHWAMEKALCWFRSGLSAGKPPPITRESSGMPSPIPRRMELYNASE